MSTTGPKLDALATAIERIVYIAKFDASAARHLPDTYAREVDALSIAPGYSFRRENENAAMKMAKIVKAATMEAERARGDRDRRARLQALAGELEGLRAVICGMAADACIEIGFAARAMREEASQ